MRVAGELAVAVHAAEVEAEDDLAEAIAGGLVGLLERVEAGAFHELAHEHLLGGQLGDDARHDDERVTSEDAVERPLVLGLELVVELVVDPQTDLLGGVLDVQAGSDPLHQP